MAQGPPEKPVRDLAEWDAEIEAEFQLAVGAAKRVSAPHRPKSKGWQRHYTVIPREWELRLLDATRVSTYRLAIELLYLHWHGKGKPVTVSGKVAKSARLSVRSKSRALAELEQLGLIETDRSVRKSPRVVMRHM